MSRVGEVSHCDNSCADERRSVSIVLPSPLIYLDEVVYDRNCKSTGSTGSAGKASNTVQYFFLSLISGNNGLGKGTTGAFLFLEWSAEADGWMADVRTDGHRIASHRTGRGRETTNHRQRSRETASSPIRVSHSSQSKHRRSSVRRHRDDDDDSRNYFSSQRRGNRIHVWTAKAQQANKDREIMHGMMGDRATKRSMHTNEALDGPSFPFCRPPAITFQSPWPNREAEMESVKLVSIPETE